MESCSNGVPTVVHKLCGKCKQLLTDGQECSNHDCKAIAEVVKDHIFFELPLDEQIKNFFKGIIINSIRLLHAILF